YRAYFYVGSFMVCHFYNGGFRGARNCYADASFFKNTDVADGHRRFSRNDSAYDSRFFYTDQFALSDIRCIDFVGFNLTVALSCLAYTAEALGDVASLAFLAGCLGVKFEQDMCLINCWRYMYV